MTLVQGPQWSAQGLDIRAGRYPLSVERHVMRMADLLVPGITTVTPHARYYALHALVAAEAAERELTVRQTQDLLRRAEVALAAVSFAHERHGHENQWLPRAHGVDALAAQLHGGEINMAEASQPQKPGYVRNIWGFWNPYAASEVTLRILSRGSMPALGDASDVAAVRERNTAYISTERDRAADLAPQPRPAPALEDPGAADGAVRHADRFSVLTEVLRRERSDRTATEMLRQELEEAASLATLAPIWADVTRSHATRRYENELRPLLAAAEWERYEHDAERGTLTRLLRSAELAGHDVVGVLHRAVEGRDFAGARSIAAVLHSRVQWLVGTEPAAASYAERTPGIEDPEADQFARDLAAAMDERVSMLGTRTALDRPAWALRYLGQVPVDPAERADWARRAGIVAAYREERGFADEMEAIGLAPDRASPEQRATWHAAYVALRMPEQERETAAATDGELWARRSAYERETRWTPAYVATELREAHLAEDAYHADAVRAWFRADAALDEAGRDRARQEAEANSALAQEVGAHREALEEIAEARKRWHAATELPRRQALMADTELRRRHPDLELPPMNSDEEADRLPEDAALEEAETDTTSQDQPDKADLDIKAALAAARRAQQILADRERQADYETELDSGDVMRRRETEARQEADTRRGAVRQEPAPSRQETSLELNELELEAGQ